MTNNQIKELQKKVMQTHGVTLNNDDPILITHTINTKLMEDNARLQQALLDEYKKSMEEFSLRWDNDVKEKSERILNASLTASKGVMADLLEVGAKNTASVIQKEMDISLLKINQTLNNTKQVAMVNLIAASLAFIASGTVIFGLFFR